MRVVLVCGDRKWADGKAIFDELKAEHKKRAIQVVVEGGQNGADKKSKYAAWELGIQVLECEALWQKYGAAAGPIRNQNQLQVALILAGKKENLLVLAFHDDLESSKGTKSMVNTARKYGVETRVVGSRQKHPKNL